MNKVLEDLKDVTEDELEETKRKIPKWTIKVAALFVIGIFIIYLMPGDVLSVFGGQLESSIVDETTVEYDSGLVIFEGESYEKIKQIYLDNSAQEVKICLVGIKLGVNYHVSDIYVPSIFSQSVIHVSSEGCSDETIISMHTHPYRHCLFSEQDVKGHAMRKQNNPILMSGLMCEIDRFAFLE